MAHPHLEGVLWMLGPKLCILSSCTLNHSWIINHNNCHQSSTWTWFHYMIPLFTVEVCNTPLLKNVHISLISFNFSRNQSSAAPGFRRLTKCYRNFSTRELGSLHIWWAICTTRSLTSCTADSWSTLMRTYLHSWSWVAVWQDLYRAYTAECHIIFRGFAFKLYNLVKHTFL